MSQPTTLTNLYVIMAQYGWRDIHYNNAFLPGEIPAQDNEGAWSIGVYTGPGKQTLCVKECRTTEEVANFRSPKSNSINDAITKSRILIEGRVGCRGQIQNIRIE